MKDHTLWLKTAKKNDGRQRRWMMDDCLSSLVPRLPSRNICCVAVTMLICRLAVNHVGFTAINPTWFMACPVRAASIGPDIYVPYEDLAHLIEPADKAVLMDRGEFEQLLAEAESNTHGAETLELGQIERAEYSAEIAGETLTLTGTLQVVSLSKGPVAVPLGFAQIGLTRVLLDGNPAPLGYDEQGKLTLIVTAKGNHQLEVTGTTKLKELSGGGMQFSVSLPAAVAASCKLSAPGDLEIHATVPASKPTYDKKTDRTNIQLTLGGQDILTVVLLGNGRKKEDRAILLGESATTVRLTQSHQTLDCLYTLQVLRLGARELQFRLPSEWTITKVTCPGLVRWSIDTSEEPQGPKTLGVRLRSDKIGTTVLRIEASAVRESQRWYGPHLSLVGAAYQRGYLTVSTAEGLSVQGQELTDARREDASAVASMPGMVGGPAGHLFFHWGDNWSVGLELAAVELRRSIKERQSVLVSPDKMILKGDFEVTAIDRELFDMTFVLGGLSQQWQITSVQVDEQETGFEYRVERKAGRPLLRIELPRPIRPERMANVTVELQHVPSNWQWASDAAERDISVPLIESQAEIVSGHVLISALNDLDVSPGGVPEGFQTVPVGRMASLGIQSSVQHAYSYNNSTKDGIELNVSRRRPRTSGDAVGLVTVDPRQTAGDWRITYTISRASGKRLYLLADKSLGREIKIASATVPISSKSIVSPEETNLSLSDDLAQRYDLWSLDLDHKSVGEVVIDVHYERPRTSDTFTIPLVRPICRGQISEQLAIQASEELALTIDVNEAGEIDAVDLPALPVEAGRVLAAFRLDAANPGAAITLKTSIHQNYEIPSALATSAQLTTYLDPEGGQRTKATFNIANAGEQFLTIRLPEGAELWSLRVAGNQAKPQQSAQGDYQVALAQSAKPIPVKIVYACQPKEPGLEQLRLGGVELPGVKMNEMSWMVVPPPNHWVTAQETTMQTSDLIVSAPVYVRLCNLLVKNLFAGSVLMKSTGFSSVDEEIGATSSISQKGAAFGYKEGLRGLQSAIPPPPMDEAVTSSKPKESEPVKQKVAGVRLVREGRFTLPVELVPTPGAGPQAKFTGLGAMELIISLTSRTRQAGWWILGFVLIAVAGVYLARQPAKVKMTLIVAVLATASLLALWLPATANFSNGAFIAAVFLVPLYVLIWFARLLGGILLRPGAVSPASASIVTSLALIFCLGQTARATEVAREDSTTSLPPTIIPYEGHPGMAEESDKILIPYAKFVELWNQAHPEDMIEKPRPGTRISLSDVQYKITVKQEQLNMLLTTNIETYGKDWVVLGLPISGLAVTRATIDGEMAQLQAGPKGTVLMVPGGKSGRLELQAVVKPTYLGRRGSASFSLPPLPGAVMTVVLPEKDLELEVDRIEAAPVRRTVNGSVEYTFGLGMTRKLSLQWLPKIGSRAADRTLSANSDHDVYAFHWAIVGVSRITYSFSSGEHDRFALMVPKYAMLTELKGSNVRDFRQVGEKTVDDKTFKLIEVQLHRPAQKQYELTARWLGELSVLETPTELSLVRAGDVGRESGTVTLHSAGGMGVKVARVSGGRRANMAVDKEPRAAGLTSDRARAVAKYYWPYRPFAIFVQLSRLAVSPKVHLDQLVRVNTDRAELLVQANLKTEQGKLFGASFALPDGYELLSAVGPAVENFYERSGEEGKFLHIKFNRGQSQTQLALALLRRDIQLESFETPTVMYLDRKDSPLAGQKGRLAIQVAASLEARTASVKDLKSISPQTLRDWLDVGQINSVQFAYRYQAADPALQLAIRRLPSAIRMEAFAGLVVRATAAVYTYRLRYNISGSPVDNLSFRLPSEYAPLVAAESQVMRSVTQTDAGNDRTQWTVALVNEVTGIVDVVVNFALPIDASTKILKMPAIQTDAPAGYRATVAVQNMSRHEINVETNVNLSELAVSEQQKIMPREMRESLQYVFESFEDNWSLSLGFKPAKTAVRIQAVVDLLELTTVIDRSGRCRYEARVALQNRSEQFLRIEVPYGLRLWSASVAGQPVKPVMPGNFTDAEVLIPLVKTSPGGLPYDISLYFADDGAEPLVPALKGITRLKPPNISIVGIPIMQTTWSLRLPSGYRYIRPGGNMSPVVGTVEMLSFGIEARLEQLRRLERTYRDVADLSVRKQQVAKRNWDVFNEKLGKEIQQVQSYLDSSRSQVGQDDYERLQTKLSGQRRQQDALLISNTAFDARQNEQARNDLNVFLNADASNPGVSEIVRNQALLEKPDFLSKSEEQQITRLRQELEVSEQQAKLLEQKADRQVALDQAPKDKPVVVGGTMAGELIAGLKDKGEEMDEELGRLRGRAKAQIDQKQAQLRGQL
ncbi:MAG: hypothetical protein ACYSWW_03025, partial [Planctomycetota bacterium]